MVNDGETGLLFKAKDAMDLQKKISFLFDNPDLSKQYGNNGYIKLLDEYSAEVHYQKLMNVFNTVLKVEVKNIVNT